ncbi:MAG: hypothetical protein AB7P04_08290 [Bacteriovoracia bacterium]
MKSNRVKTLILAMLCVALALPAFAAEEPEYRYTAEVTLMGIGPDYNLGQDLFVEVIARGTDVDARHAERVKMFAEGGVGLNNGKIRDLVKEKDFQSKALPKPAVEQMISGGKLKITLDLKNKMPAYENKKYEAIGPVEMEIDLADFDKDASQTVQYDSEPIKKLTPEEEKEHMRRYRRLIQPQLLGYHVALRVNRQAAVAPAPTK